MTDSAKMMPLEVVVNHNNNNITSPPLANGLDYLKHFKSERRGLPLKASIKESLFKLHDKPQIEATEPSSSLVCCPFCQESVLDIAKHISVHHKAITSNSGASVASKPLDFVSNLPLLRYVSGSNDAPTSSAPPTDSNMLLRTAAEMLAKSTANNMFPQKPLVNQGVADSLPMNLSTRNAEKFDASKTVVNLLKDNMNNNNISPIEDTKPASINNGSFATSENDSSSNSQSGDLSITRKRRKQTHVPDSNKDERYWARRMKNNEAAKRSRDMRIRREKIVFEENARLEKLAQDLREQVDAMATENKELHLKMDIIMEENSRLKSLLLSYQNKEVEERRHSSSSNEVDAKGDSDKLPRKERPNGNVSNPRLIPVSDGGDHNGHGR